jgi:hypothetical protein
MRFISLILISLIPASIFCQRYDAHYFTSSDSTFNHYFIEFRENGEVLVRRPFYAGLYIKSLYEIGTLNYERMEDTIHVYFKSGALSDTLPSVLANLGNSKILIKSKDELVDINSGSIYVTDRYIRKKGMKNAILLVFENRKYKSKKLGSYLLKRRLKRIDPRDLEISILKGKEATDKYGSIGINGVIEFNKK